MTINENKSKDDNYSTWINNILDVYFCYHQEKITLDLKFEDNERMVCTVDEISSQSKMKEKMEEKFQVTFPTLDEDEYFEFICDIISSAFYK